MITIKNRRLLFMKVVIKTINPLEKEKATIPMASFVTMESLKKESTMEKEHFIMQMEAFNTKGDSKMAMLPDLCAQPLKMTNQI